MDDNAVAEASIKASIVKAFTEFFGDESYSMVHIKEFADDLYHDLWEYFKDYD